MNIKKFNGKFKSNILLKKDDVYNKIIVHCTGWDEPETDSPEYVHNWHINKKGWAGIGYQFFINRKGEVFYCRPLKYISSHCKGYNTNSIGICMSGSTFDDKNTKQFESLIELCASLRKEFKKFGMSKDTIYPHNFFDLKGKTCPNFSVQFLKK